MGDYVGDITTHAKNETDRPSGSIWANGQNVTLALKKICNPKFCSCCELKPVPVL